MDFPLPSLTLSVFTMSATVLPYPPRCKQNIHIPYNRYFISKSGMEKSVRYRKLGILIKDNKQQEAVFSPDLLSEIAVGDRTPCELAVTQPSKAGYWRLPITAHQQNQAEE